MMKQFSSIRNGSKGTDVIVLQALLRSQGLLGANGKPLDIDGEAGSNTIYALNQYKKTLVAYGSKCVPDGVCDNLTWSALLGL